MTARTNLARAFRSLLPASPLYRGEILAHNADGTSTVELPGGMQIRARGQIVGIGAYAFVRNGVVEGAAPNLPVSTVDI